MLLLLSPVSSQVAGCRCFGLFPGCRTKVLFIPSILCPVHPGQLNPTTRLGQSILGRCWSVFGGCRCVHTFMVTGDGAWDPQSCPLMLCLCLVPQLSAGCRARTVGAAPSLADVPAHPAGQGEPARQVLAVTFPSSFPALGLPHSCWESSSEEQQGCHGAWPTERPLGWGADTSTMAADQAWCCSYRGGEPVSPSAHTPPHCSRAAMPDGLARKGWEAQLPGEL